MKLFTHSLALKLATISGVATCLILSGCLQTPKDRGFVQREWAMSLRELGIIPVFPPREDFQVGDIYADTTNFNTLNALNVFEKKWHKLTPKEKKLRLSIGIRTRVHRINLQDELYSEYAKSITAPATPQSFSSILGSPELKIAQKILDDARGNRTKLEAAIKAAEEEKTEVAKALLTATREKNVADNDVRDLTTYASTDNAAARAEHIDSSQYKSYLSVQKSKAITADSATKANNASQADPMNQTLQDELKAAQLADNNAQVDLDRALANWKALKKATLDDAVRVQTAKNKALTAATQTNEGVQAKTTPLQEAGLAAEGKIDAARTAVTNAEATLKAFQDKGSNALYAQPNYGNHSIYKPDQAYDPKKPADTIKRERTNRFKIVGFPQFSTVSFSQSDLSALIPIEAMQLGLNISNETVDTVSVNIPSAESFALSTGDLREHLVEQCNGGTVLAKEIKEALDFQFTGMLNQGEEQDDNLNKDCNKGSIKTKKGGKKNAKKDEEFIYLTVISEVFYARAMDISLFSSQSFGARTQVSDPLSSLLSGDNPTGIVDQVNITGSSALDGTSSGTTLDNLRKRLGETQSVPGGTIQFASLTQQSIGLRRIFDRPIAIGYRGLTLKVKPTGDCFQIIDVMTPGMATGIKSIEWRIQL